MAGVQVAVQVAVQDMAVQDMAAQDNAVVTSRQGAATRGQGLAARFSTPLAPGPTRTVCTVAPGSVTVWRQE